MKKKSIFYYFSCLLFSCFFTTNAGNFSKTYSRFLNQPINSNTYIWENTKIDPFTELILSWNALRPQKGKLSFFVSVNYINGKQNHWSPWERLAEWGNNNQQTFVNTKNAFVHNKHVKVELKKYKKATGFRIKAFSENGASLNSLKALFVCLSDMNKFHKEKALFNLPSTRINGIPKQSQMVLNHPRHRDLCSPTSLSIILNYFAKNYSNLESYIKNFSQKVHDDSYLDIYGNWPLNVAQAYDSSEGNIFFRVERLNGFNNLYHYLKRKIPVAVSVRGTLNGGAKAYDNGHFIVIVGWDNRRKAVLCIDPAFSTSAKTTRAYGIRTFLKAWENYISPNLSYIAMPKKG